MKSSPSMRYFPLYASIDLCNAARSATPNRRIVVWPVKHHAADDLDTRAQCDWVGRKPAGRVHGAEHIFFAANKSNIERIPRNAGRSCVSPWVGTLSRAHARDESTGRAAQYKPT